MPGGRPEVPSDLADVARRIAARGLGIGAPLDFRELTTSTNDDAKAAAREGAVHGTTFVAEAQTGGRGRQGRAWVAVRGESLLVSVLLRAKVPLARVPPVALVAGLAVRDAVAKAAPEAVVAVKWPNDVLVDGRKVAGILVESTTAGNELQGIVVGFGINVHTRSFPDGLADTATSVALATRSPPDRAAILVDVLAGLDRDVEHVLHRGLGLVHARLRAADGLVGRRVKSELGEGTADGIDVEGRLVVVGEDGTRMRWSSGEVHLAKAPPVA